MRRASETDNLAPLFTDVKGSKPDLWRILGNPASLRLEKPGKESGKCGLVAISLGWGPTVTWKDLTEKTIAAKDKAPLKQKIMPAGPCKENSISAEDINLHEIPVPQLHAKDGGKYMQTYSIHVLQTRAGQTGRSSGAWFTIATILVVSLGQVNTTQWSETSGGRLVQRICHGRWLWEFLPP